MNAIRPDVFGWFDGMGDVPAHDPGREAACPVCAKSLAATWPDVTTVSLALLVGREKSYFFRAHRKCWREDTTEEERAAIESSLIDAEARRVAA